MLGQLDFVAWNDARVQAALISAVVAILVTIIATPLRYFIDRRALRHKLRTEYEYEQRKYLRDLIGLYHGRLLQAAEDMNSRVFNLYLYQDRGWLKVPDEKYSEASYYFRTTVYRFLAISTLVHRFEGEALYIDSRIAEENDFIFLKYVRALRLIVTEVSLFRDLEYDESEEKDHFFADTLKKISSSCWSRDRLVTLKEFEPRLGKNRDFDAALQFFNNLKASETRLRWDRLVAFHLLLAAFINTFGYDFQRKRLSRDELKQIVGNIQNIQVCRNLVGHISKYDLNDSSAGNAKRALKERIEENDTVVVNTKGEQSTR
jgi:hypothetical protein